MNNIDLHTKDLSPNETLKWINGIMKENGMRCQEIWNNESQVETSAVRLCIEGTEIGTNGKGISKEYALASAYGEFMERFQNGYLSGNSIYRTYDSDGILFAHDEKQVTIDELISADSSFLQHLFHKLSCNTSHEEKQKCLEILHKKDNLYGRKTNTFISIPFYSTHQRKVCYLPLNLYLPIYGSNGMCAGNTREEALVQGFSEIAERYVQRMVLTEKITLPDIPQKVWSKYKYVDKYMQRLLQIPNYKFILKDCSLGGKYPVAALIVIEKNTGRYGVKFGAHPNYEIAIERTITEATQSGDINEYSNRSVLRFEFDDSKKNINRNIENSFRTGYANYPIELFYSKLTYPYYEYPASTNLTNQEYLGLCLKIFKEKDIFIRNVSYSGFPSFHILIPGISEISEISYERYNAMYLRTLLYKYLNSPELITEAECDYVISSMHYFSPVYPDLTMRNHYGTLPEFQFPAEELGMGWLYISAMCSYMKGDDLSAASKMSEIAATAQRLNVKTKEFFLISTYYLKGRSKHLGHAETIEMLSRFFNIEYCKKVDYIFVERDKVIVKQYPKCEKNKDFEVYKEYSTMLHLLQEKNNIDQINNRFIFENSIPMEKVM